MKIYSINVDEMPKSCGQCPLMDYTAADYPVCYGIVRDNAESTDIREIQGNPYDMQYRRSDCPLVAMGGIR